MPSERIRYMIAASLWLAAGTASVAWVFGDALNLRSPYLLKAREAVFWIWLAAGPPASVSLLFSKIGFFRRPHPHHTRWRLRFCQERCWPGTVGWSQPAELRRRQRNDKVDGA